MSFNFVIAWRNRRQEIILLDDVIRCRDRQLTRASEHIRYYARKLFVIISALIIIIITRLTSESKEASTKHESSESNEI
jgi:hypothetical protein